MPKFILVNCNSPSLFVCLQGVWVESLGVHAMSGEARVERKQVKCIKTLVLQCVEPAVQGN